MNDFDPSKLAGVWADAAPLGHFIADRADAHVNYEDLPELVESDEPASSTLRTIEGANRSFAVHLMQRRAHEDATGSTLDDLVAGRIVGLGRRSNSYEIEEIAPSFWIGAEVDIATGNITRGGTTFVDVRITDPKSTEVSPMDLTTGELIQRAIAHFANDPNWFNNPPDDRHRSYRAYIRDLGRDPRKEPGFTKKTFEKYESIFRSKTS